MFRSVQLRAFPRIFGEFFPDVAPVAPVIVIGASGTVDTESTVLDRMTGGGEAAP